MARAALQVDQVGPVGAVERGDLAREDGDLLAVGPVVVERDGELVLGEDDARCAWHGGHPVS